ncbi:MAG TPA: thiamine phosphate synthase [Vicinamibacterales bacterium]|nr:thiamine phosphate synthase [Vicinamibacterales bacterium]
MLCLVTDRRRHAQPLDGLLRQAAHAIEAGVDLIQIRERDLEAAQLMAIATAMLRVSRRTATKVVINDRLDVAIAAGADGVHLRGDSFPVAAARRLAPADFLIGRSVRTTGDAIAAAGADYLIAGTVFPSASKAGATSWMGPDGLRAIVRATAIPVLAIGGVTLERLPEVAATGAAGIAAISLFADTPASDIVAAVRRQFDSAKRGFLT